jgi:hypothetical protein
MTMETKKERSYTGTVDDSIKKVSGKKGGRCLLSEGVVDVKNGHVTSFSSLPTSQKLCFRGYPKKAVLEYF